MGQEAEVLKKMTIFCMVLNLGSIEFLSRI